MLFDTETDCTILREQVTSGEPLLFTAKTFRGAPEKTPLRNSQKCHYPQEEKSEGEGKRKALIREEGFYSLPSSLPTFTEVSQPRIILRIGERF